MLHCAVMESSVLPLFYLPNKTQTKLEKKAISFLLWKHQVRSINAVTRL
jgi:hypothetical protein